MPAKRISKLSPVLRLSTAAAASAIMLTLGVTGTGVQATAAPATTTPATDGQGYLNSTARCTAPDVAVAFGDTETSRVAICKTSAGKFQYRGVRVRDGAKLIAAATQSSSGAYVAESDGITYTVTSSALSVSTGTTSVRDEEWLNFRGSQTAKTSTSTSTSSSSSQSTTATATTPTSTTPLPPPLAAEVGG